MEDSGDKQGHFIFCIINTFVFRIEKRDLHTLLMLSMHAADGGFVLS